jgi:hypothetical protein
MGRRKKDNWTPTTADWELEKDCFGDLKWAYENFFGKSISEAEVLIESNPQGWSEDLMWMTSTPFKFYIRAYMNCLTKESDSISGRVICSFIFLITHRAESKEGRRDLLWIWNDIEKTVKHIWQNREKIIDWYGSDGNLEEQINDILSQGPLIAKEFE